MKPSLTLDQVIALRARFIRKGETLAELARVFHVNIATVFYIVRGRGLGAGMDSLTDSPTRIKNVQVRKYKTAVSLFQAKIDKTQASGCWVFNGAIIGKGYRQFRNPVFARQALAHRVAWIIEHGAIPVGLDVLHLCNNPGCVRPDHLELGTDETNTAYKLKCGRHPRGADVYNAILSKADVLQLRAGYFPKTKHTIKTLSQRYGVTEGTVRNVVYRRSWKYL